MTVALPTGGVAEATPRFIDRGGLLVATLGGDDQRLDRLGSKFGVSVTVKPMKGEDARIWIARLIRGMSEKASLKFPQPGIVIGATADFTVSGAHAANAVALTITGGGGQATKAFVEGQFITVIFGGKRFVHYITTGGTTNGSGVIVLGINPPLRRALAGGEVVEVLAPKIEGYVRGDQHAWTIDNAKIYGLSFDIEEAA